MIKKRILLAVVLLALCSVAVMAGNPTPPPGSGNILNPGVFTPSPGSVDTDSHIPAPREGVATWWGPTMSSVGQPAGMEPASPDSLQCCTLEYTHGSVLRVTNLANNKSVDVRVISNSMRNAMFDKYMPDTSRAVQSVNSFNLVLTTAAMYAIADGADPIRVRIEVLSVGHDGI